MVKFLFNPCQKLFCGELQWHIESMLYGAHAGSARGLSINPGCATPFSSLVW